MLLKIVVPALACLVLGIAVAPSLLPQRSAPSPYLAGAAQDADARLAAMEARLDRIDNALATLADRSGLRPVSPAPGRAAAASDAALRGTESPAEMESQRQAQIIAYANAFRNQKTDPAWGLPTEALLLDKMGSDHVLSIRAQMPTSRSIGCRTDMCELKFTFAQPGDAVDWTDAYVADLGKTVGRTWHTLQTRPDGSAEIILYGFR